MFKSVLPLYTETGSRKAFVFSSSVASICCPTNRATLIFIFVVYCLAQITRSIVLAQQEVRQMHDLDSIDIARSQFIHRYHIFGVVVFDLQ